MKFYISFGQAHAHRINNRTFDCDSLLLVEAPDEISARIGMNTEISNRWCGIYKEEDLVEMIGYYPRGILNATAPIVFPSWKGEVDGQA
jgi:hypothetical protein